jgi:pyruvate-formate lyase-activating enzyme
MHPDMPFEDFAKVLRRVKETYDSHKIMIVVTGGEPLMRKDIEQCGRAIYDMEFPWGIVSNGLLMTPRKIDGLLRAGMHSATISLDGFQEEHEWMRGIQGSFKNASEAIRILANEPSIKFDVVTCVNNRNYESLPQFKEYLISLGLKSWRLFTVFPVGRAAQDPELQLSNERFRGLMEFIKQTRKEGRIMASYGCEGFLGALVLLLLIVSSQIMIGSSDKSSPSIGYLSKTFLTIDFPFTRFVMVVADTPKYRAASLELLNTCLGIPFSTITTLFIDFSFILHRSLVLRLIGNNV